MQNLISAFWSGMYASSKVPEYIHSNRLTFIFCSVTTLNGILGFLEGFNRKIAQGLFFGVEYEYAIKNGSSNE